MQFLSLYSRLSAVAGTVKLHSTLQHEKTKQKNQEYRIIKK